MNDLVILKKDDVFTTSKVIADGTGISHKKIKNAINKYKIPMETFGKLVSYGDSLGGKGKESGYFLNEQQSTF